MLKMINGYLKYANTPEADTARNAFESVLSVELAKANIVSTTPFNMDSSKSNNNTTKILNFRLFYTSNNAGVSDWNSFWTASQTEKNSANVLAGSYIKKCDDQHDVSLPCINWVQEVKH